MGTQISFEVSNITGPRVCQLVIANTDGSTQVVSSWNGRREGLGNRRPAAAAHAAGGHRAHPRADRARPVQALSAAGTPDTLVQVP